MSTENQNGSAGTQSNGIKASIGVTSTTRTVANNSSFLYSNNSMLNRDKPRQVPPPTLPKYTSSFNAGSNGSGTTERLNRDRDVGGSYRLTSLDRLALRQRILDGEKANGDTTSVSWNIFPRHFFFSFPFSFREKRTRVHFVHRDMYCAVRCARLRLLRSTSFIWVMFSLRIMTSRFKIRTLNLLRRK